MGFEEMRVKEITKDQCIWSDNHGRKAELWASLLPRNHPSRCSKSQTVSNKFKIKEYYFNDISHGHLILNHLILDHDHDIFTWNMKSQKSYN